MKIRERLQLDDYVNVKYKKSEIDPEKWVEESRSLTCPRCKKVDHELSQGKSRKCECGLTMKVSGASLYCEMERG